MDVNGFLEYFFFKLTKIFIMKQKIALSPLIIISLICFSSWSKAKPEAFFHGTKCENLSTITITSITIEDNDESEMITNILPNTPNVVSLYTYPPGYVTFTAEFPASRPSGRVRIMQGTTVLHCVNIPAGNGTLGYVFEWTDTAPNGNGYYFSYTSDSC